MYDMRAGLGCGPDCMYDMRAGLGCGLLASVHGWGGGGIPLDVIYLFYYLNT